MRLRLQGRRRLPSITLTVIFLTGFFLLLTASAGAGGSGVPAIAEVESHVSTARMEQARAADPAPRRPDPHGLVQPVHGVRGVDICDLPALPPRAGGIRAGYAQYRTSSL